MKWQPWKDYDIAVNITEPPCKKCKHFMAQISYYPSGLFEGVKLCHAEEMFQDFSCFKEIKGKEMKPYNPYAKSPKCGKNDIKDDYNNFGFIYDDEKITRICNNCGYYWLELPLDAEAEK